jgi:hypothetical protein
MADLGSCEVLKTVVNGRIFTNTTFEVSAEDIRSSFEDTIDTLCGNVTVMPSYADLNNLVINSKLEAGGIYIFPYETVSLVGSTEAPMLNTSVPGYVPLIEQIAVVAKDETTFFSGARSINFPQDIIMYDFTDNVETVTTTDRPGLVYYRKDTRRNIETYYDFRNNYVARYDLNSADVQITATQAVSRGQVIYYNVSGSTVSAGWYFVNISATDLVADAEANPDVLTAIDEIDEAMYSNSQVEIGTSNITANISSIAYHQSIDGVSENIALGAKTTDVLIVNSTNIEIGADSAKITVNNGVAVHIGKSSNRVIAKDLVDSDLGTIVGDVHVFGGSSYKLEFLVRNFLGINATCTTIGTNSNEIVSIGNSSGNEVGCESNTVYFLRDAEYNVLGKNNANITLFKANNNTMAMSCSSIQIYGGSNNRFAQSCTLINMLGDRDEALGLGTSYVSPYSKMDNNTFGTSCENISFENVGGKGNTFGDECANLVFTNTSVNPEWRLVGCDFARGIRNKTFELVLHGAAFIVPNQETATIGSNDWFVPQIYVGAQNVDQFNGSIHGGAGDRLTSSGSQNIDNWNKIAVGYKRAGWFFDAVNAESVANKPKNDWTDPAQGNSDGEYKLFGPPTNKAFGWTHDGYPLLSDFINTNVPNLDPTSDITG